MVESSVPYGPVRVELLTAVRRIFGNCRALNESTRLGFLLNSGDEQLVLSPAIAETLGGKRMQVSSALAVEKRSICIAIPCETEEQLVRQKRFRRGMVTPRHIRLYVALLCPPFTVSGTLHLPFGAAALKPDWHFSSDSLNLSRLGPGSASRFVTVTEAALYLSGDPYRQAEAVFVNKETVTEADGKIAGDLQETLTDVFAGIS